ncbi:MAG: hypothetical protein A3B70_07920 [Deltaproteobacteria bacterium RIFCSPHIGHO2_02_FULL_40_11]|nr:MAG: hypothetical protein A3B70_07920 [Deltaproteobacteria bacterium RIFCSPHIGHO2_02_FULL_40_11]
MRNIFKLLENIEKAVTSKTNILVIDKSGKFHKGQLFDHYVRLSADKLRGKIKIKLADRDETIEVDANDILDIEFK